MRGIVVHVLIRNEEKYLIQLDDTDDLYEAELNDIVGKSQPIFHMEAFGLDDEPTSSPPPLPERIKDGADVTLFEGGYCHKGKLNTTD